MLYWVLQLVGNLCVGARIAFNRKIDRSGISGDPTQLFAILLLHIIVACCFEIAAGEGPASFNIYGLNAAVAGWALFAAILSVVCSLTHRLPFVDTLLLYAASSLWITAIGTLGHGLITSTLPSSDANWVRLLLDCVLLTWLLLSLWFVVRGLTPAPRTGPIFGLFCASFLTLLLLPAVPTFYNDETDWNTANLWEFSGLLDNTSDDEDSTDSIDVEGVYYDQVRLLDAAISKLKPQRPGVKDIYFLGFAGDAHQDVFLHEVSGAREILDKRFSTTNRSLVLANHLSTLSEQPLANMKNLEAALARFGRIMDPEEDILFLFLSSHGDRELLSTRFHPFRLNTLTAEDLKEALARSGIQNSLIVISACHSGSFIPILQNDQTAILTASHADKVSFGCGTKRKWTYFGDAYFNHALRREHSFIEAFAEASKLIGQWETAEGLDGSEPQLFVGSKIAPILNSPLGPTTVETPRTGANSFSPRQDYNDG